MSSLQAIHIYPIKSCGGISLSSAEVSGRGFPLDRRWMLVDDQGIFLSQRNTKGLGQVKIQVSDHALDISAPGHPSLKIPLDTSHDQRIKTQIWKDEVEGRHVGPDADRWFSRYLDKQVRLVHMDTSVVRRLEKPMLPQGSNFEVSFADGYPYLLTNQASLDDLNERLEVSVPMDRFRSNLVVSGFPAFAEDKWKRIQIGAVEFLVVKPCARCQVTTIDQRTGEQSKEPLKTLARYRKVDGKVMFGMNLVALNTGIVAIGDSVRINK